MQVTWTDPLALDTETALIAAGLLAPPLAVSATADSLTNATGLWSPCDPADAATVAEYLATRCIVGANFAYDAGVYMAHDPGLIPVILDAYDAGRVRDVQHDQRLLDIAAGHLDGYTYTDAKGKKTTVKYYYSLDALNTRYGFDSLDKDTWRLRYGEFIGVPLSQWPAGALDYPAQDAIATLQVHFAQDAVLADTPYQGRRDVFIRESCAQARAALALQLMSCYGVHTDPVHTDRVIAFITEAADRARDVCLKGGILRASGSRNMSLVRDRVLAAYADRPILITEAGNKAIDADPKKTIRLTLDEIKARGLEKYVSTDGDVLSGSGDPVLEACQMYGSAATRLKKAGTLRAGTRGGKPLQTRYDVLKDTGRTSSKAPGGTMIGDNFQNFARASAYGRLEADGWNLYATPTSKFRLAGPFPDRVTAIRAADAIDVRGCFTAEACSPDPDIDPGVLSSVDYPSMELHTWAQTCLRALGFSRMAEVLNAGKDPHLLFAAERLLKSGALDYAAAEKLLKAKDPDVDFARQFAKVPNYGLPGMLGPATFVEYAASNGFRISLEYSEFVHGAWREMWDEAVPFFDWVKSHKDPVTDECVMSLQVSGRTRGGMTVPACANYGFQGPGADMAKSAGLVLWRECLTGKTRDGKESPLYGSKPLLFLHDEYLMWHPTDVKHDAANRFAQVMFDASGPFIPDVPFKREKVEPALMHRWHKGAKAVYVNGRLEPWEPVYV